MWRLIRVYVVCVNDLPLKIEKKQQNRPDTTKMTNRLVQHITVHESTSFQWVALKHTLKQDSECDFFVLYIAFIPCYIVCEVDSVSFGLPS